jgi:thioesterase domain-containing protein
MAYNRIHKKLQDLQELIVGDMPITKYLQFSIDRYDENGLVLSAPLAPNVNHRGTAFGGSISMMATLAGYGMTLLILEDFGIPYHIVVQKGNISFNKPVKNNFKVICSHPKKDDHDKFKKMFLQKGMGRIYQHCTIQEIENNVDAVSFNGAYVAIRD